MAGLGGLPLFNDYSLCTQAATVYHNGGDTITRTVHERAYLDFKKTLNVERTGSSEASAFLLVVPGGEPACEVGDKVFCGIGPEVPQGDVRKWWASFIPAKVPNLVVVRYVDPKFWNGAMVHTEAGG